MKIVFRLNYHTSPGQTLWLKYAILMGESGVRFDQETALYWINDQQWETVIDLKGSGRLSMEYSYQLRQVGNGVRLDEWMAPRTAEFDASRQDALVLLDDWCSAGTVDYAFETNAFQAMLPGHRSFDKLQTPAAANTSFRLRMAAVPLGMVPCVIGSVSEIGDWGWHHAVPLQEVAANEWRKDLYLPNDWEIDYKYGLFDLRLQCLVSMEHGENRHLAARNYGEVQWTQISDESYRRDSSSFFRGAGVAIPVFSLRSAKSLGVGEFSDLAPLADWASGVGLKLVQILPINDTTSAHDWTDSYPYSAISVFALHPIYLCIEEMEYAMPPAFMAEIIAARTALNPLPQVDYEAVMKMKLQLTRQIFNTHHAAILGDENFQIFLAANRAWVVAYAAFCTLRDHLSTADFSQWNEWAIFDQTKIEAMLAPTHPDFSEVIYHIWLQSELDRQLAAAVRHLHSKGLALKGDLPIGIDRQSVDAWAAPHLFKMDAQAGAPPDDFAVKGQNWGFPTYNWEVMKRDDYAWWRSRFEQLSRYFDAYRIDHILGFFRIWQVPFEHVEGIMGYFDPALPIHINEIRNRGIEFDFNRFCRPYIREHSLAERFQDAVPDVKKRFLNDCGSGYWQLRENVSNQRRIVDCFAQLPQDAYHEWIKQCLLDCASEVLFFEVQGSHGTLFHPRCSMKATRSYRELHSDMQWRVEELYVDYFYRRQEDFWQAQGYEKLPAMRQASPMLLCGEDLGMVPACVPGVMKELGILSLEIQRMPKSAEVEFFHPARAPYMSVVSPSTHDMATLRAWWKEDSQATSRFAWQMLGMCFPPPELSGEIAVKIIQQHLHSPAMWAVFPLQDLLAMDEKIRLADDEVERINVPAIIPYYWRYRMHLDLAELGNARDFNEKLAALLVSAGRAGGNF